MWDRYPHNLFRKKCNRCDNTFYFRNKNHINLNKTIDNYYFSMQSQLVIGKQIEINLERHHKLIKLLFVVVLKTVETLVA